MDITASAAQTWAVYNSIRGLTAFSKKFQFKNLSTYFCP